MVLKRTFTFFSFGVEGKLNFTIAHWFKKARNKFEFRMVNNQGD